MEWHKLGSVYPGRVQGTSQRSLYTEEEFAMTRVRLLLTTLASFPVILLLPQPSSACQCPFNRIPSTIHEGVGATCLSAQTDAEGQAYQEAEVTCAETYGNGYGVCGATSLIVTQACYWDSAADSYKIRGRIYYNCWDCEPLPWSLWGGAERPTEPLSAICTLLLSQDWSSAIRSTG